MRLIPTPTIRLLAAAAFAPLLALWTWKLLEPQPVPEPVRDALSLSDVGYLVVAKLTHAGVYAVLAALIGTAARGRRRWVAAGLLVGHGAGTELGQYLMAVGRTGKVTDVLIDAAGVAAGTLLAWGAWRARGRPVDAPAGFD